MSLNKMTIKEAIEIIDLITPLMVKRNQESRFYFGYSELKGYDMIDIDNALKLFNAYYYYKKSTNDEELTKLLTDSKYDGGLLINLCSRLVPDATLEELNKYQYGSHEYYQKVSELVDVDIVKSLKDRETLESFLENCIIIGKDDPDYWIKVYYSLGLVLNPDDEMIFRRT